MLKIYNQASFTRIILKTLPPSCSSHVGILLNFALLPEFVYDKIYKFAFPKRGLMVKLASLTKTRISAIAALCDTYIDPVPTFSKANIT